jgi:HD-GYP domain-containing protein (c-di-GMP phosphodiesterase class II)/DNA-binding CsgD family transcriptional regulator
MSAGDQDHSTDVLNVSRRGADTGKVQGKAFQAGEQAEVPREATAPRDKWARSHDLELAKRLRAYQPFVLERLATLAVQAVGAETSTILAGSDGEPGAMTVAAAHGEDAHLVGRSLSVDSSMAERMRSARATAAAPIHFAGRPAGLLSVYASRPDASFGESELALLAEFAELCGFALGQHDRRAALAANAEVQVRALETALGIWDGYTADHSRAVVRLALRVGQRLGMDALELIELDLAARLHDIGKIRVPGDILRKPGRLDADERRVIELHPTWGAELAGRIPGLQAVAAIIGLHHERADGSGYPYGLAGDRIPLASSIVAACDAYGAMTEHRPYREALSASQTLAELGSASGRQFHPDVVSALSLEVATRPLTPFNDPPPSARSPRTAGSRGGDADAPGSLSPRERDVLTLLASGATSEDAATALGLSRETVRTHVRNAIGRLGAHTRTHAVALALDSGQIELQAELPESIS